MFLSGQNGLPHEDFEASVATLQSIATSLGASCTQLRLKEVEHTYSAQYLVREIAQEKDFTEIR